MAPTGKLFATLPFDTIIEVLNHIGVGEETDTKNATRWVAIAVRLSILRNVCKTLRRTIDENWKDYTEGADSRQLSLVRDLANHFQSSLSIRVKHAEVVTYTGEGWGFKIRVKLGVYPAFQKRVCFDGKNVTYDWKPQREVIVNFSDGTGNVYSQLNGKREATWHPFPTPDVAGGPLDPRECNEDTYWVVLDRQMGSYESRFGYNAAKVNNAAKQFRGEFSVQVQDLTSHNVVRNNNRGKKYKIQNCQLVFDR